MHFFAAVALLSIVAGANTVSSLESFQLRKEHYKIASDPRGLHRQRRLQETRERLAQDGIELQNDYEARRREIPFAVTSFFPNMTESETETAANKRLLRSGSTLTPSNSPPTSSPAAVIEVNSFSRVVSVVLPISIFKGSEFLDPTSYQAQALAWLVASNTTELSDTRVVQRYALAAFYYATNTVRTVFTDAAYGEGIVYPWQDSSDWLTDADECIWARVGCDSTDSVITLDQFSNVLSGEMPPEISLLSSVQILDVGSNVMFSDGSNINSYLGQMTSLVDLRYDNTNFINTNGVPTEIGLLKNLESYSCASSLYRGALDGAAFPEDMANLTFLEIEFNSYNSTVPAAIGRLPALERFYVRDSFVEGGLQWMSGMQSIAECWVDTNVGMGGTLPTFLGTLSTLASFSATECTFSGTLPTEIGVIGSTMSRIWLSDNIFVGGVPSEWSNLTEMEILEVQDNSLSQSIPSSVCDLRSDSLTQFVADCKICPTGCCSSCVS